MSIFIHLLFIVNYLTHLVIKLDMHINLYNATHSAYLILDVESNKTEVEKLSKTAANNKKVNNVKKANTDKKAVEKAVEKAEKEDLQKPDKAYKHAK